MDDTPDRGYSRAPELEDLVSLCRALNREGVRYVLIGGFAVILHGLVRTTKDVDLLIDPDARNIQALRRAMGSLPDNAIALVEDQDVAKYRVVRVADEIVVDLMAEACGVSYADAIQSGVERLPVGDVEVPVASKELLIRVKDTLRDSDKSDVSRPRFGPAGYTRRGTSSTSAPAATRATAPEPTNAATLPNRSQTAPKAMPAASAANPESML